MALEFAIIKNEKLRSSKSRNYSPWTVIKITTIHSTDCNQITMGIWTRRNIVIITTNIFAVNKHAFLTHNIRLLAQNGIWMKCVCYSYYAPYSQVQVQSELKLKTLGQNRGNNVVSRRFRKYSFQITSNGFLRHRSFRFNPLSSESLIPGTAKLQFSTSSMGAVLIATFSGVPPKSWTIYCFTDSEKNAPFCSSALQVSLGITSL
jgi:hypothetical protein